MSYTFIHLFTTKKEKSEELKLEREQLYIFFLILVSFTPFHPSVSPNVTLSLCYMKLTHTPTNIYTSIHYRPESTYEREHAILSF